jgi:trehalose utilization protein
LRVIAWSDDDAGAALEEAAVVLHPDGINATVAAVVRDQLGAEAAITIAGLHEPDDGLPESVLVEADVLVWWGHEAHEEVAEDTVARVHRHVLDGLGLVVLHSAHHSKIFRRLMGTSGDLAWRDTGEDEELIWAVDPAHPIAAGVELPIDVGTHEMYGEPFDIPAPDELVFLSAFTGGEVFRSGCCFKRGAGRIFYFGVGHETYPVYAHPQVQRIIGNAVRWAQAAERRPSPVPALEAVPRWGAR